MPKDRARAKLACRIAGVDPDRFNEMASLGQFPCAPPTIPGAARIFDVNDIVTLIVFRHLADEGVIPSRAGPFACGLRDLLREHPEAERVVWVKASMGAGRWTLVEHFDRDSEADVTWGNLHPDVVSFREWRLRNMREYILHKLNEDGRVAGEE